MDNKRFKRSLAVKHVIAVTGTEEYLVRGIDHSDVLQSISQAWHIGSGETGRISILVDAAAGPAETPKVPACFRRKEGIMESIRPARDAV